MSARFGLLNVHSVKNKTISTRELIHDNNLDFLALTETWLSIRDSVDVNELSSDGNKPYACPTLIFTRRGVGLLYNPKFEVYLATIDQQFSSFELMNIVVKSQNPLRLTIIYRPPPLRKNNLSPSVFIEEFEQYVSEQVVTPGRLVITVDINVHLDDNRNSTYRSFQNIHVLHSYGLTQHVCDATNAHDHNLDLVISTDENLKLSDTHVKSCDFSDHSLVLFSTPLSTTKWITSTRTSRKWSNVNRHAMANHITSTPSTTAISLSELDEMSESYNNILTQSADEVTPEIKCKATSRHRNLYMVH